MASIFFRSGPANGRTLSIRSTQGLMACASGSADEILKGKLARSDPSSGNRHAQTLSALVRAEGLEPPQLSSLEPKSSASTSSATPAYEHHVRPRCRGRRVYNMGAADGSKKMAV
jgi:hypothetical protein